MSEKTKRIVEPFTVAPDATVTAGGMDQEHDTLSRQQKSHGVQVTQAAVDPSLAEDSNPKRRNRPDTIPEVQARVLAVMDLSQAFGFGFEEFRAAILGAVNEEHTESDANCWCGKLHPKKRKEAGDGDGS